MESRMAWMQCGGVAAWSDKASPEASEPRGEECEKPTAAVKDMLKLRKRLREMVQIEERFAAGLPIDLLQQRKLEKKGEVVAQLVKAERAVVEEQLAVQTEQPWLNYEADLQQASELQWHEEDTGDSFGPQMAPMQYFPVPVLMCDVHGQPQPQVFAWPSYACASQEPHLLLSGEQLLPQPEVGHATEQGDEQERSALTVSARRRLRRQRAAERRADAFYSSPEACAPASEPPSPCSAASSGQFDSAALAKALEEGGEARAAALAKIRGSVFQLSFERQGCRVVQAAIQVADHEAVVQLLSELHGHVRDALASPHANYVLQTIITALPTAMSTFLVKELWGVGGQAARHRFGCRILCRLVEHSGTSAELEQLLGGILAEAEDLCRHAFAHYVMQAVLEHLPQHRQRILEALRRDPRASACHRCASHVVEAALAQCGEEERQGLVLRLVGSGPEDVVALAQNQYGSFVLRAVLQVPGRTSERALGQLAEAKECLAGAKYGQRLLHDLGLAA